MGPDPSSCGCASELIPSASALCFRLPDTRQRFPGRRYRLPLAARCARGAESVNAHACRSSRAERFEGVLQILAFNWTFYAMGAFVLIVLLVLSNCFAISLAFRLLIYPGMALTLFWMISSLLVSHYVYDRFPLYRWQWLIPLFDKPPAHWANIHAGLDQTSVELGRLFPDPSPRILDIYDTSRMTEASIKRARRRTSGIQNA